MTDALDAFFVEFRKAMAEKPMSNRALHRQAGVPPMTFYRFMRQDEHCTFNLRQFSALLEPLGLRVGIVKK